MSLFKNKSTEEQHQKKIYNILIVDDEEANVRSLIRLFEKEYNVYSAFNGKEALNLVIKKEIHFHLIISDQKMPLMNGIDFLKETLKISPDTIRIILSAFTDLDVIISSINEAQIYKFIVKPIDIADILLTVKRALQTYEINTKNARLLEEIKQKNIDLQNWADNCKNSENSKNIGLLHKEELQHIMNNNLFTNLESLDKYLNSYKDEDDFLRFRNLLLRLTKSGMDIITVMDNLSSTQELKLSYWNLASVIKQAIRILDYKLKEKLIKIEVKINPDIEVKIEKISFLNIIILNILSNAIKYSYNESTIKIISNNVEDKFAIITISDQGTGIEANILNSIFDAKKENIRTGTLKETGDGIGLKLTKKILEKYNGSIRISSDALDQGLNNTEVQLVLEGRINKFGNS